ncbi:MAG: hypothetical protein J7619_16565 [Dyadobacter sp.]|uniref:hypothetical protein n=1 Tax=Dyadobacter sp. TaxID=1914288 RepID=UPI001B18DD99|nr:hypothetical protein [Dyadobacter sp.]MBO9614319.1 hypothetical protein [Dyadobacter sp.]
MAELTRRATSSGSTTCSFVSGATTPMPTRPFANTRAASALFARTTSGWLSVVPMKFVAGLVPALPEMFQPAAGVVDQTGVAGVPVFV